MIKKVSLSPVPILPPEDETLYMVLCEVNYVETSRHSSYKFYTDSNTLRRYTDPVLPNFLRVKFSMIKAADVREEFLGLRTKHAAMIDFGEGDCYRWREATKNNPEFKYIGWQISDTLFVIVCDKGELSQLRGYNDTREKSKRKSKEET